MQGTVVTIEDAKNWVDQNTGMLANIALKYTWYAPYAVDDYLQDAYEAAVKAAICCQKNPAVKFEACFFKIWRTLIASVTPFPDEAREASKKKKEALKALKEGRPVPEVNADEGKKKPYYSGGTSMSFPINAGKDIPLEVIQTKSRSRKSSIDIEAVYLARVKPLLSAREAQAMELSLGITLEGHLSLSEIAAKMGVTKDTAREYLQRSYSKAEKSRLVRLDGGKKTSKEATRGMINLADDEFGPQELLVSNAKG